MGISDPARHNAALAGALPRRLNQELLSAAVGEEIDGPTFDWLVHQPFVTMSASSGYQYHDVVRAQMLCHLRHRSVDQWRSAHSRLADLHRRWCTSPSEWKDPTWQYHRIEATYHDLCADPNRISILLPDTIDAAATTSSVACRWVEAIAAAGQDGADTHLAAIGTQLGSGWGATSTDCRRLLTAIVNTGLLNPSQTARAHAARGKILYYADEDAAAILDCNQAIAHDANLASGYAVRGAARHWLSQYEEALADLTRAVSLDGNDGWAIAHRGETCRLMGRYDEALADFTRAIGLDGNYGWAIAGRGQTYQAMGRYDEALTDFTRAISLDSNYLWARAMRARVLGALGRAEEAIEHACQAMHVSDATSDDLYILATVLLGENDPRCEELVELTRTSALEEHHDRSDQAMPMMGASCMRCR